MLYRKSSQKIKEWIKNGTTALLIDGARQVGKSTLIEECLQEEGVQYVKLNLLENQDALEVFNSSKNLDQLMLRLTALSQEPLIDGKTVFFIDEIQAAEDAITPIKFLVDDSRFRYILSGSLLGIKLKDIKSLPVGFLDTFTMYPMDFEEFLIANNVSSKIITNLKECFQTETSVDEIVHNQLMNLFKIYLVVGGMPAAVQEYVTNRNLRSVQVIHNYIDSLYKLDIAKYDKEEKLFIDEVYDLVPSELNNQNKRFILKNLNEKARYSKYENSLVWLKDSGVGLFVYNVDNPVYPLLESKERSLFKLFLCDTGLLTTKLYGSNIVRVLNKDVDVNFGSIYESFVAQELIAHNNPLYYYNNKKRGEVDFLVEEDTKIIPIEVKSGKDYMRHSALKNLLEDHSSSISKAYVLNNDSSIQNKDGKIYIPIYMIMFFEKETRLQEDFIYNPDISALTD